MNFSSAVKPLRLWVALAVITAARATTLIYPVEAIDDLWNLQADDFKVKYAGINITGLGPSDEGWYVRYRHENLTYMFGPLPDSDAAQKKKWELETVRDAAIRNRPSLASSKVDYVKFTYSGVYGKGGGNTPYTGKKGAGKDGTGSGTDPNGTGTGTDGAGSGTMAADGSGSGNGSGNGDGTGDQNGGSGAGGKDGKDGQGGSGNDPNGTGSGAGNDPNGIVGAGQGGLQKIASINGGGKGGGSGSGQGGQGGQGGQSGQSGGQGGQQGGGGQAGGGGGQAGGQGGQGGQPGGGSSGGGGNPLALIGALLKLILGL